MKSILVVCSEEETFRKVRSCFSSTFRIAQSANKQGALDTLAKKRYDLVFIDINMLDKSTQADGYKSALQSFWQLYPSIEIIVMSPQEMIRDAVKAVKAGASNYVTYPLDPEEVKLVAENIQELKVTQSELEYLRDKFWDTDWLDIIKTKNPIMKDVYEKVRRVAPTKSTVLLSGETGTGKSVIARLIHRHSNRRENQFISVHCGAIPDTLLESELFGHEKGAFTGAVRRKLGKFEIASGGTIFLDEIGTITPSAQIKLLQVLQDGTFQRVGGEETFDAKVRVLAATNVDLKQMCEEGKFRKDLYYRLNVFPIEIPPLRDRIEDIPRLVDEFLKKMNRVNAKQIRHIAPQVAEAFREYQWPGNIRELENLVERACILESSSMLTPASFPGELFESRISQITPPVNSTITLAEVRRKSLEETEKRYLKALLSRNNGKIKDSAAMAGITTRQLHKLMAKYGLHKEDFKPV